jgi:hypothetical protein
MGRIETPDERNARVLAPWTVIHFENQDTSTISTADDNDIVIARVSGPYRRDITESIVADHNAAARLAEAEQELARAREALEAFICANGHTEGCGKVTALGMPCSPRCQRARAALAPAGESAGQGGGRA